MARRIDEYSTRPSNPVDGDVYRDEDGIQWKYIAEVNDWGIDLTDPDTNERYHGVDQLPRGKPAGDIRNVKGGIAGAEAVLRWLDENM